ncbi:MAG: hypothetical protein IPK44_24260 [Candidatus Accumulibacter sp.]|uniref:hypothetical protein n=1 Tax=Accumulibacter sp. TaxID=2053492 RepID=UPI002583E830|nr:hypothetical protein [Accumulibacter sp.]MBK8117404.1 hypothetical protein [Accumulibacter sp.]
MWATKPKPAAYADGGAVETPEQVMARMAKKYGTGVPEQRQRRHRNDRRPDSRNRIRSSQPVARHRWLIP